MADRVFFRNIDIKTTPTEPNHAVKMSQLTEHTAAATIHVPASNAAGKLLVSANVAAPTWLAISTTISSGSTDAQVPSAKSVYSYVSAAITALNLATTYAPASHAHAASEITSGTIAVARLPIVTSITAAATNTTVPSAKSVYTWATGAFASASHAHAAGDITSGTIASARLPAATTSALGAVMIATSTDYDVTDDAAVMTVKAVATYTALTYALKSHTHAAGDIASGTISSARLPLVTAISSASTATTVPTAMAVYDYAAPKSHTQAHTTITGLGTAATVNTGTTAGTIPVLDSNGKLPYSLFPQMAYGEYLGEVADQAAMIAKSNAGPMDTVKRTDTGTLWFLGSGASGAYATASNWVEITAAGRVTSVNGLFGEVVLTAALVGALATSALVTSVTSASTDSTVPSAKSVYTYAAPKTHTHPLSAITDAGTAAAAGLVTSITSSSTDSTVASAKAVYDYAAPKTHNHAAGEITSGKITAARLPVATSSGVGGVKVPTSGGLSVSSGAIFINFGSDINLTSELAVKAKAIYTFTTQNFAPISHSHAELMTYSQTFTPTEHADNIGSCQIFLTVANTIAPVFSSAATYAVGDYVTYQGNLYKCTTAVTSAGAWADAKWTAVRVMNEMAALRAADRYDGSFTGDGSTTEWTITHGLGVKNVFADVIDSDGHSIDVDIQRISTSALKIIFGVAPTSADGTFAVIVRS